MPNEEWGVKRVCPGTGKRFYDLNRSPVISPYTGEVVEIEKEQSRAQSLQARPEKDRKPIKASKVDEDDDLLVDDDDSVDVDDDLLDDDDDDSVALDDLADVAGDDDDS